MLFDVFGVAGSIDLLGSTERDGSPRGKRTAQLHR